MTAATFTLDLLAEVDGSHCLSLGAGRYPHDCTRVGAPFTNSDVTRGGGGAGGGGGGGGQRPE